MTSRAVLFVAPESAVVGRGHLNRCAAIAGELARHGIQTAVFDPEADVPPTSAIAARGGLAVLGGFETASRFLDGHDRSLIFIDHYGFRHRKLDIPSVASPLATVMIDDFEEVPPGVDVVIRQTRTGSGECTSAGHTRVLAGEHLAPVRLSFFGERRRRTGPDRLLLCCGTSVLGKRALSRIVAALVRLGVRMPIDLASPLTPAEEEELRAAAAGLDLTVHGSLDDLSVLVARAAWAICTPSVTAFELSTAGMPLLLVSIIDNQEKICEHLVGRHAGARLDLSDDTAIESGIAHYLAAPPSSFRSALRSDGLGARRIAGHLRRLLKGRETGRVRLEAAVSADAEFTSALPPMPGCSASWLEDALSDPAQEAFMAFEGTERAGAVLLRRVSDGHGNAPDKYEVAVAFAPGARCGSVAEEALVCLADLFPEDRFIARVPTGDRGADEMFRTCGYVPRRGRLERAPGSGRRRASTAARTATADLRHLGHAGDTGPASSRKVLLLGYGPDESSIADRLIDAGCELWHTSDPVAGLGEFDAVVSFGYRHILRGDVLDTARRPVINLHIGYLPFNRGAHPNFWSFFERTPNGVTIHEIDEGIDTGPVICQKTVDFAPDENTFAKTHRRLIREMEELFARNIGSILSGGYEAMPQPRLGTLHRTADLPDRFPGWDFEIDSVLAAFSFQAEVTRVRTAWTVSEMEMAGTNLDPAWKNLLSLGFRARPEEAGVFVRRRKAGDPESAALIEKLGERNADARQPAGART